MINCYFPTCGDKRSNKFYFIKYKNQVEKSYPSKIISTQLDFFGKPYFAF